MRLTLLLTAAGLCLFLFAAFIKHRPKGCGSVQIWSHRGHLDSSSPDSKSWSCQHVLTELKKNEIRHLDVDILFHEGNAIVAHPTEMGTDLGNFSPSPCSRMLLTEFIEMLQTHFGEDFYVTMEPKSAWTQEGPFLSPPEKVVGGILDSLDKRPVPHQRCGVILDTWQAEDSRIAPLVYRIQQHCIMVTPFRRNVAPLDEKDVPPPAFKMMMPTHELFGGPDGKWWLHKMHKAHAQVILWVVDTVENLTKALKLDGVHGVISNHPVRLKKMYEEICPRTDIKLSLDV